MTELSTPHEAGRPRVFISYSTADRQRVAGLASLLEALGHSVFIDYRSILPGRRWEEKLEEALRGADVLLVFWTRHAAQSKWVRWEYESFDTQFPDRPLVPVLGDTTPLTERLQARQYSDFCPLLNELLATVRDLKQQGVSNRKIRAAVLQRLKEEGIELPRDKRHLLFGLFGIPLLTVAPLYFLHRKRDLLVDKTSTLADDTARMIAAVPSGYYATAWVALTAGLITCHIGVGGGGRDRSVQIMPNLSQVDVRLDQSGSDACDAQDMICVSMSRHPIIDRNRKFFGYTTPPCSARVIREPRCSQVFQTDYAISGVVLRRSPEADAEVLDLSGTNYSCLPQEEGKQGIFQFANCVKP